MNIDLKSNDLASSYLATQEISLNKENIVFINHTHVVTNVTRRVCMFWYEATYHITHGRKFIQGT